MQKEKYINHLCGIISMVFRAEDAVNDSNPNLKQMLKSKQITGHDYIKIIAEEIVSKTPDGLIPDLEN